MGECAVCSREYKSKKDGGVCLTCVAKTRTLLHKLRAIQSKGGKCKECGWFGPPSGFAFHHTDPSTKEGDLSKMFGAASWEKIEEEIEKCDLLCLTCHSVLHANEADDNEILLREASKRKVWLSLGEVYLDWLDADVADELRGNLATYAGRPRSRGGTEVCRECGKAFRCETNAKRSFCSRKCSASFGAKISRASGKDFICERCGREFHRKKSQLWRASKFCGKGCHDAAMAEQRPTLIRSTCEGCGAIIEDTRARKYCTKACQGLKKRNSRVHEISLSELESLHESMSWNQVAIELGVPIRDLTKRRRELAEA